MKKVSVNRFALFGVLLALVLVCLGSIAASQDPSDPSSDVVQGNLAYQNADYRKAAALYGSALEQGIDNGHVYYNLGNAHYRLGQYGLAIANYRRALRQLPSDPDVLANLSLARKNAVDSVRLKW